MSALITQLGTVNPKTSATKNVLNKIVAIMYAKEKGVLKDTENIADIRVLVNYILKTKAVSSYIHTIRSLLMTTDLKMLQTN